MATKQRGLLELYNECKRRGLNVIALDGWDTWEPGYYWYDRNYNNSRSYNALPLGALWHHTATSGYTPYVVSNGKTKANIWMGLQRPGTTRLYSTGSGVAVAVFAASGPANYGNGNGQKRLWDQYGKKDIRFQGPMRDHGGSDNAYANRAYIGIEVTHPGDGSMLDPGVWELEAQLGAAMDDVYDWKPNSSHHNSHEDSTTRKIDQKFKQGAPYTMDAMRDRIIEIHSGTTPPGPDPGPDPEEDFVLSEAKGSEGPTVKHYQERLVSWRSFAMPSGVTDKYTSEMTYWVTSFQNTEKILPATGDLDGVTTSRLDSWTEDNVDTQLREDLATIQQQGIADLRKHEATPHGGEAGEFPHTHKGGETGPVT